MAKIMKRNSAVMAGLAVMIVLGSAGPAAAVRPTVDRQIAVLQGLDKVTAQVSRMQV